MQGLGFVFKTHEGIWCMLDDAPKPEAPVCFVFTTQSREFKALHPSAKTTCYTATLCLRGGSLQWPKPSCDPGLQKACRIGSSRLTASTAVVYDALNT